MTCLPSRCASTGKNFVPEPDPKVMRVRLEMDRNDVAVLGLVLEMDRA
jgi:hypothetical protein